MQCPQCKRIISAVPGASRVQCFGCGSIVELAAGATGTRSGRGGSNKATKAIIAVVCIGLGLAVLVGVGFATFVLLLDRKSTAQNTETAAMNSEEQPNSVNGENEPLVPAYVATAEDRALAGKVAESNRRQIIQMWDQMTATTRKKLLIPKNSYTRNRVEDLLGGIEQREIKNMAALLQVEETQVSAVIQVEMADRAGKELLDLEGSM